VKLTSAQLFLFKEMGSLLPHERMVHPLTPCTRGRLKYQGVLESH